MPRTIADTAASRSRRGWQLDGFDTISFRVMLIVLVGIAAIMFMLGRTAVNAYRHAQIDGVAAVGSLFIEGILTPHAYELLARPGPPEDLARELEGVVSNLRSARHFAAINIWSAAGALRFNSRGYGDIEIHDDALLLRAQNGEIAATLVTKAGSGESPIRAPYVEVYAPIFDNSTEELVAIGEIYIDARDLVADRQRTEAAIWLSTIIAAIALTGLTGIVAMQRRRLIERYAQLVQGTATNLALLQKADNARTAAAQANEAVLNEIGGALHDGPLQMLTLAALRSEASDGPVRGLDGSSTILRKAMRQLRQIAAGLILPEIGKLSAGEAIRLAAARHKAMTGTTVDVIGGDLAVEVPEAVRTCLYRVVQEGLANAFRHGGSDARVTLHTSGQGGRIVVEVENGPPAAAAHAQGPDGETEPRPRLGLDAMRHRIDALGGVMTLTNEVNGRSVLRVELPYDFGEAAGPVSSGDVL